jgi:hypothetical protein
MYDDYTTHRNVDGTWRLSVKRLDDTGYVEVSTHDTHAEALQGMVDAIVEEKRVAQSNLDRARARQDATERQLDELQSLIEGLPWNDINSGEFSPQQGCGDVAMFRDYAIRLGCDSAIINDGADRAYTIDAEVTIRVSFTITTDSEENAHDIAEMALEACESEWTGGRSLDDFEINETSECIMGVEEC